MLDNSELQGNVADNCELKKSKKKKKNKHAEVSIQDEVLIQPDEAKSKKSKHLEVKEESTCVLTNTEKSKKKKRKHVDEDSKEIPNGSDLLAENGIENDIKKKKKKHSKAHVEISLELDGKDEQTSKKKKKKQSQTFDAVSNENIDNDVEKNVDVEITNEAVPGDNGKKNKKKKKKQSSDEIVDITGDVNIDSEFKGEAVYCDSIKKTKKKKQSETSPTDVEMKNEDEPKIRNGQKLNEEPKQSKAERKKKKVKKDKVEVEEEYKGLPKQKVKQMKHEKISNQVASDKKTKLAIEYMTTWKDDRANWKFKSLRESFLIYNCCNPVLIPDEHFDLTMEYLCSIKGALRKKVTNIAKSIKEGEIPIQRAKIILKKFEE